MAGSQDYDDENKDREGSIATALMVLFGESSFFDVGSNADNPNHTHGITPNYHARRPNYKPKDFKEHAYIPPATAGHRKLHGMPSDEVKTAIQEAAKRVPINVAGPEGYTDAQRGARLLFKVANQESSFDPEAGRGRAYQGVFQIGTTSTCFRIEA